MGASSMLLNISLCVAEGALCEGHRYDPLSPQIEAPRAP
jgi:hypothetical protein